ncbi:hypothetical protein I3760_09G080500 [Carya illinoinensis]|nr:hypothetical protein I3760_09G080500 [Carya illinoinensis]
MCYSKRFLLLGILLILFFVTPTAQYCYQTGNYTSNSTYRANLVGLLASMSSNAKIDYGLIYNFTAGENSDKVNAIALCRGDITADVCRSCINSTSQDLLRSCPNQKEAIGWSKKCTVRYSNRSIFGVMEEQPMIAFYNVRNASDVEGFSNVLRLLLDRLRNSAALGNSTRKFALGSEAAPDFQTIYSLVQCTPDLNSLDCNNCLLRLSEYTSSCCNGQKVGGVFVTPSCYLRYEKYGFYDPAAESPPPSPPPPPIAHPVSPPPLQDGEDGGPLNIHFPVIDQPPRKIKELRIENGRNTFCLERLAGHDKANELYQVLARPKKGQDVLIWMKEHDRKFLMKSAWKCIRVQASPLPRAH